VQAELEVLRNSSGTIVLPAAPLPCPRLAASSDVAQAGTAGELLTDGLGELAELDVEAGAVLVIVLVTDPPDGGAFEPHAASRTTPEARATAAATRRAAVAVGVISFP
jgi:hypothetical protein